MEYHESSSKGSPDAAAPIVRARRQNSLHVYLLAGSVGNSDFSIDRHIFEQLPPHSSPSGTVFYESATMAYHEDPELDAKIDGVFGLAVDEGFEDGMEGRMSYALNRFVAEHPVEGTQQLAIRVNAERTNPGVAADIVRVLGQMQHERSHGERRYLAECLLYSKSPLARDAAAVALGDLADRRSVPALQRAVDKESIPALKADMHVSLDGLMKDTDGVRSPETRP